MFENFTVKESELGIRVVKSRNAFIGAAAERCNAIMKELEKRQLHN